MTPFSPRNLLSIAFLLAAAYGNDLKVVTVVRFPNGTPFTSVRYFHDERTRLEWRDHSTWKPGVVTYGPPRATIYKCDAQRAVELNLKSHEYSVAELNDECRSKNAPPLPAIKGTVDVYIETTDTGERQQMLGRTARHIITHQRQVASPGACWGNGEMESDGWYIEMEQQQVARRFRQHSDNESVNVIRTGANCRDNIVVHRSGMEKPGRPVKLVQTSRSLRPLPDGTSKEYDNKWEMEVTELNEAPLDTGLFEIPANFTKVAKIDGGPEMPFSVAVEYWWDRALRTVRSWF